MNNLKKVRNEQHLTVRELAKKTRISPSFISGIENGKSNPTLEIIRKICNALNKKIEEIF